MDDFTLWEDELLEDDPDLFRQTILGIVDDMLSYVPREDMAQVFEAAGMDDLAERARLDPGSLTVHQLTAAAVALNLLPCIAFYGPDDAAGADRIGEAVVRGRTARDARERQ